MAMQVDLKKYADALERQRNMAFNESAMLAAALEQAREEIAVLRAALEAAANVPDG